MAEADYSPYLEVVSSGAAGGSNGNEAEARAHDATEVNLHRVPKYVLAFPGVPDAAKGSLVATSSVLPDRNLTPHFDMVAAMRHLAAARERLTHGALASLKPKSGSGGWPVEEAEERIGHTIMYGEVVTSTQTLLDKNPGFLKCAPSGLTILATQQVSGRGRGKNAWISPRGCLQFSTVLELPLSCASGLVFVQYLAALAIVEAVRHGLGEEYAPVGRRLRIKWPNDVYAEVGSAEEEQGARQRTGTFVHAGKRWAKLAGVLVNSSFSGGKEFRLVVGCGINCLNARPTTSISDVIALHNSTLPAGSAALAPVSQEALSGAVLATLEKLWRVFLGGSGSFAPFRERYAAAWLHSDQIASLGDTAPPTPVRIVGVTSDHGTLRAVPVESELTSESPGAWGASEGADAQRGPWIDLQPDGNSFSMLENLIRSKT